MPDDPNGALKDPTAIDPEKVAKHSESRNAYPTTDRIRVTEHVRKNLEKGDYTATIGKGFELHE